MEQMGRCSQCAEVFIWRNVHNTLWQTLSKDSYDTVRDRLIDQLENKFDRWRKLRHPDDETYFVYTVYLADGDDWHTFEFLVDDTAADTCVIVVDVIHSVGKNRIN